MSMRFLRLTPIAILAAVLLHPALATAAGEPRRDNLGVYIANNLKALKQFEDWLGRPVDYVAAHTGRKDWKDWENSVSWATKLWAQVDRKPRWSVPIFADGGSLEEAAAGTYNDRYVRVARRLAATRPQDETVIVRTGEEFNGGWMPWAAKGKEDLFAESFRQFVTSFRSVSPRFRFEWNVNVGDYGTDPAKSYPGDEYVDIIGMDFYYDLRWDDPDAAKAWQNMVNRKYGLKWHQDFAKSRGKPTAYSEWGVPSDQSAAFVEKAHEWFDAHDVVYQIYWDSNDFYKGKLSNDQFPATGAAFKRAFGPAAR